MNTIIAAGEKHDKLGREIEGPGGRASRPPETEGRMRKKNQTAETAESAEGTGRRTDEAEKMRID
jgi:hypothetical protein